MNALSYLKSPFMPSIGMAILVWIVSVAYGFQYLIPDEARDTYFRLYTLPYTAVLVAITWFALTASRKLPRVSRSAENLALLMMSISWFVTCYFYSNHIAVVPWWLLAFAIPLLSFIAHRQWSMTAANLVFLVGLYSVALAFINEIPSHTGADMLQIIELAGRDFINGDSPYRAYLTSSGKEVPFGYWPGIWLPYLPFISAGLDLRVLNLIVLAALLAIAAHTSGKESPTIVALTLGPFILSPALMQHIILGHLWTYWFAATLAMVLLVRKRYHVAALVFGYCLASRPTALFIAGPLMAYLYTRLGLKQTLRLSLIALIMPALLFLPLAIEYGQAFLENSFGYLTQFGHKLNHISLAGFLYDHDLKTLRPPIQLAIMLSGIAVIAYNKDRPIEQIIMLTGATYLWMMLFSSYATRYMYYTGYFLIAIGLCLHYSSKPVQK